MKRKYKAAIKETRINQGCVSSNKILDEGKLEKAAARINEEIKHPRQEVRVFTKWK